MDTTDPDMAAALSLLAPDETDTEADAVEQQVDETADAPEAETDGAPDDAEEQPEVIEQPQRFTVKVDGQDVEVTLDELQRGYAGQAYILKGMQEAAAKRKEAEALAQTLQAEQRRFLEFASAVQQQGLMRQPTPPNPQLAAQNQAAYVQAFAKYQQDMQAFNAQQAQIVQMRNAHMAAERAAQEAFMEQQAQTLRAVLPDIADPAKGPELRQKLVSAATSHYGFSEAEVMGVMDARAIQVLHDAARYRELMAQKATAKAAPQPPKNVAPKASNPEPPQLARGKLKEKARKTQNIRDFAALLLTPET